MVVPSMYDRIIPILASDARFLASPEYRLLVGTAEDLPGIVAASYAAFVGRSVMEGARESDLRALIEPLNTFASWQDVQVNDMLEDEVLERFMDDGMMERLRFAMNPHLRSLLEAWLEKTG